MLRASSNQDLCAPLDLGAAVLAQGVDRSPGEIGVGEDPLDALAVVEPVVVDSRAVVPVADVPAVVAPMFADAVLAVTGCPAKSGPDSRESPELQELPSSTLAIRVPKSTRRRSVGPATRAAELLGIPAQPVKRGVTRTGTGRWAGGGVGAGFAALGVAVTGSGVGVDAANDCPVISRVLPRNTAIAAENLALRDI